MTGPPTDRRLSDQSVALIVKRRPQAAGIPPGRSPVTRRRRATRPPPPTADVEERKTANVTRHRNLPVLRRYITPAPRLFDDVGEVI